MDEIVILNTFNYDFTISAKTVCFFVFFHISGLLVTVLCIFHSDQCLTQNLELREVREGIHVGSTEISTKVVSP